MSKLLIDQKFYAAWFHAMIEICLKNLKFPAVKILNPAFRQYSADIEQVSKVVKKRQK